jgi:hypothetical protein
MRVSTLQGANMKAIGDWLLAQPVLVGMPLTVALSLVTGFAVGSATVRLIGRR